VLVLVHEDSHRERLLVQDQADNILMDLLRKLRSCVIDGLPHLTGTVNKDMYLRRAGDCVVLDDGEVTFPAEKGMREL
jgi:hypothetical protein